MTAEAISQWIGPGLQIVQFVVTLVIGFFLWILRRDAAQRTALTEMGSSITGAIGELRITLSKDISDLDKRLTRVEADFEHRIDSNEVRRIHARIDILKADLAELKGESRSTHRLVHEINEYLRNHEGGSR